MPVNYYVPHRRKEKEGLPKTRRNIDPMLIKVGSEIKESQMENLESCLVGLLIYSQYLII